MKKKILYKYSDVSAELPNVNGNGRKLGIVRWKKTAMGFKFQTEMEWKWCHWNAMDLVYKKNLFPHISSLNVVIRCFARRQQAKLSWARRPNDKRCFLVQKTPATTALSHAEQRSQLSPHIDNAIIYDTTHDLPKLSLYNRLNINK